MIETIGERDPELNFRQRWASYLTIAITLAALASALLVRARLINATAAFQDDTRGIAALYPAGWLLDQRDSGENTVFRVLDPAAIPFKTTLQVALSPSTEGMQPDDVTARLTVSRAAQFPFYRALGSAPVTLPDGSTALRLDYAYVANEEDPFLQTVPIVVQGEDIIVLRGSQALIVTYRADSNSFDENHHYFDAFLRSLQF